MHAWADALTMRDFGLGAVGAFNTCTAQPNGDQLCEDLNVEYFVSGANSQQGVAVFTHFRAFIHPDGTATELAPELGFSDVTGSYDNGRLTFASMSGVTLDLNDVDPSTGELTPNGRTVILGAFEWVAASGVYVFGNNGPFGAVFPGMSSTAARRKSTIRTSALRPHTSRGRLTASRSRNMGPLTSLGLVRARRTHSGPFSTTA